MRQYYLSRDFILLFCGNLLLNSCYFLLMTTMARYAADTYGCSGAVAGLAASIFLVGGGIARIIAGRYANRVGYKRFTVITAVVMLAMCLLYFASPASLILLLFTRFVHGLAFGIAGTTMPAMAVARFPREHMGEGTGVFMLSMAVGTGIGPLVGLLITAGLPYSVMFVAVSIMSAVLLVCSVFVSGGAFDPQAAARDKAEPFSWRSFIDPRALRISIFMLIVAFSYITISSFLGSYAAELGLAFYAPFTFLLYSFFNLTLRPLFGRIQDRHGDNAVLYPSIASMVVGLVLCAFIQGPATILLLGLFMSTGFGTCMSAGQAAVTKGVEPSKMALMIGTFFICCDVGSGLGPVVLGALIGPIGYRGMYLVAAITCFIGLMYYHFAHGRSAGRKGR